MDQTILFLILIACVVVQAMFFVNHRTFVRGTLFSALSDAGCLAAMELFFPALGLVICVPTLVISVAFGIPGCIFLLLLKLICGV